MNYILAEETKVCIPNENLEDALKALNSLANIWLPEDVFKASTLSIQEKVETLLRYWNFFTEIHEDGVYILDESTIEFDIHNNPVIQALREYFRPGSYITTQEQGDYYQLRCFEDSTAIVQANIVFPKDDRFAFPIEM